jgi:hypothetical protein
MNQVDRSRATIGSGAATRGAKTLKQARHLTILGLDAALALAVIACGDDDESTTGAE